MPPISFNIIDIVYRVDYDILNGTLRCTGQESTISKCYIDLENGCQSGLYMSIVCMDSMIYDDSGEKILQTPNQILCYIVVYMKTHTRISCNVNYVIMFKVTLVFLC